MCSMDSATKTITMAPYTFPGKYFRKRASTPAGALPLPHNCGVIKSTSNTLPSLSVNNRPRFARHPFLTSARRAAGSIAATSTGQKRSRCHAAPHSGQSTQPSGCTFAVRRSPPHAPHILRAVRCSERVGICEDLNLPEQRSPAAHDRTTTNPKCHRGESPSDSGKRLRSMTSDMKQTTPKHCKEGTSQRETSRSGLNLSASPRSSREPARRFVAILFTARW